MPIADQIEDARRSLLDLTLRNRLLNFRTSRARTLQLVEDDPGSLFELLCVEERKVGFRAEGTERRTVRFLRTELDATALRKRLLVIERDASAIVEEQGYTALHVALWFLNWTEREDATTVHRAPLVLIPVELERTAGRQRFRLCWTGEEISANVSLASNLEEQGVTLPLLEEADSRDVISRYIAAVATAIRSVPAWSIGAECVLDFFSFTKFVMYRDLDPAAWPEGRAPADDPLLRAILDPVDPERSGPGFSEDEVDERLDARSTFHVTDADPSQIAVIEDVKAGRNLVVEGPPGTGKSQTIVNLIAELLVSGKTVLFVSEKMAALEVVKDRLEAVQLGSACLELHSRKANKRLVLDELLRAATAPTPGAPSLDEAFREHEALRSELDDYGVPMG